MTQLDEVGTTLLDAARELLTAEGPGALTVRRIASSAGLSTMNVYSRFGGKDGVVEHLFVEGFRRLTEAVDAVVASDDPVADLQAAGRAYRQFALEHPTLYSVMFDRVVPEFQPSPEARDVAGGALEALAVCVGRALAARGLHADPAHAAVVVWATCHGVMSLELRHAGPDTFDWPQVYDDACAAVARGLGIGADPT